jgi:hypothetical protein
VRESVTIAYRGAGYEIGRSEDFYAIWRVGDLPSQPLEQWTATPEGWAGAWYRFVAVEVPGTIVPVAQRTTPVFNASRRAVVVVALLVTGVALGIAGLFPAYLGGASLSNQNAELVPHAIYLASWSVAALLILLGGGRRRAGALLAIGVSAVTFGLYFADAGTVIAGGAHLMGAGLVLGLLGWLACAAGATVALGTGSIGAPARPHGAYIGIAVALALAALGTAAAFAPSWDSFTLRSSAGTAQTVTAGNAFSNPGAVIAGNVAVMVALVIVVVAAALWRPIVAGAALLAGAVIPLVAQAISALVQLGQTMSPAQFGISSSEAARAGITISSGVTPAFWIYCAFVLALMAVGVRLLVPSRPVAPSVAPTASSAPLMSGPEVTRPYWS